MGDGVTQPEGRNGEPDAAARGWLLVLCAWLGVWQPLNLAVAATDSLRAIPVRGWPLGVLLVTRLIVTAVGFAAARALWDRQPGAPALAKTAIVLSGLMQLFIYATAIAPNNRLPGDTPLYVTLTVLVHGGWLVYLTRSARVRRTFS